MIMTIPQKTNDICIFAAIFLCFEQSGSGRLPTLYIATASAEQSSSRHRICLVLRFDFYFAALIKLSRKSKPNIFPIVSVEYNNI